MNKTIKTFVTILLCLAFTGTCLAAPRGGHRDNRAPAPMHLTAPRHHGHHTPPPRHVEVRHYNGHHHDTGAIAIGAAVVGGIIGALLGR